MTVIDPRDPASVADFVRSCGLAVVATIDPAKRPEAALVGIAALNDGTLIFDTRGNTRKASNLRQNAYVAVVVGWMDGVSVQIEGLADITTGARRQEYGTAYNEQLPGSRALDDAFDVVAIRPTWVRVYDTTTEPPRVQEAHWS